MCLLAHVTAQSFAFIFLYGLTDIRTCFQVFLFRKLSGGRLYLKVPYLSSFVSVGGAPVICQLDAIRTLDGVHFAQTEWSRGIKLNKLQARIFSDWVCTTQTSKMLLVWNFSIFNLLHLIGFSKQDWWLNILLCCLKDHSRLRNLRSSQRQRKKIYMLAYKQIYGDL